MRPSRIVILVPFLLALLIGASPARIAGSAAPETPSRLSGEEFWRLSESISEPDGTFRSDNLLSNEMVFSRMLPDLLAAVCWRCGLFLYLVCRVSLSIQSICGSRFARFCFQRCVRGRSIFRERGAERGGGLFDLLPGGADVDALLASADQEFAKERLKVFFADRDGGDLVQFQSIQEEMLAWKCGVDIAEKPLVGQNQVTGVALVFYRVFPDRGNSEKRLFPFAHLGL